MRYTVVWSDRYTGEPGEMQFSDVDEAQKEANTQSNRLCAATVLAYEGDESVGSISYSFGRRGETEGNI
jgi:hypothetical protein